MNSENSQIMYTKKHLRILNSIVIILQMLKKVHIFLKKIQKNCNFIIENYKNDKEVIIINNKSIKLDYKYATKWLNKLKNYW